jgi:hypothetical protein
MNKIFLRLRVSTGVVDALATMTKYKSRLLAAWCLIGLTFTALADITIQQQPIGANNRSGTRARFSINAISSETIFYQWSLNGVSIPNADKPTYVTPILSTNDTGNVYVVQVGDVSGQTLRSAPAYVWVAPGIAPRAQPYIGVNFLSADVAIVGNDAAGFLRTNDVAGVLEQENFVNLSQTIANGVPLADSHGAATPVTLSYGPVSQGPTGTGASDADHTLFQGFIQNSNSPVTLTFSNVPPTTNYSLLVYSVGVTNNSTYEESFSLVGQITYPTLHVRAQDAGQYLATPAYKRMSSTDPNNRDLGNYVQFDNVSPAADGTLVLVITPESNSPAPVSAVQLVTVQPPPIRPSLSTSYVAALHQLTISWGTNAVGYALESTHALLGPNTSWTPVAGVAIPVTNANSFTVSNISGPPMSFVMIQKGFPFISQQPQSQVVLFGTANVSFSVVATGAPPITYQWTFNGVNITNATNATYTIPHPVTFSDVGDYQVIVTDDSIASLVAGLSVYNGGQLQTPISQFLNESPCYQCGGAGTCFNKYFVPRDGNGNPNLVYGPNASQQTGPFQNNNPPKPQLNLNANAPSQNAPVPNADVAVELQNNFWPPNPPRLCGFQPPVFTLSQSGSSQNSYTVTVLWLGPPNPSSGNITCNLNYQ